MIWRESWSGKLLKISAPPTPDTCAGKFSLKSMGGWAEGLACADPGARTPIGVSGNSKKFSIFKIVILNDLFNFFHLPIYSPSFAQITFMKFKLLKNQNPPPWCIRVDRKQISERIQRFLSWHFIFFAYCNTVLLYKSLLW